MGSEVKFSIVFGVASARPYKFVLYTICVNIYVCSVNIISIKLINTDDIKQHVNVDDHNIAYIQFLTNHCAANCVTWKSDK